MNIITEDEVEELQLIRLHRNKVAHQLPLLLVDSDHEVNLKLFNSLQKLLIKIEQWWIVEFEMAINPIFDNISKEDINYDEIESGNMILLNLILESVKKNSF